MPIVVDVVSKDEFNAWVQKKKVEAGLSAPAAPKEADAKPAETKPAAKKPVAAKKEAEEDDKPEQPKAADKE